MAGNVKLNGWQGAALWLIIAFALVVGCFFFGITEPLVQVCIIGMGASILVAIIIEVVRKRK